jgi:ribosomal subunit interface protein
MERNIEFKDFQPEDHVQELIDTLIRRLDKKMKRFSPVFLRLLVEKNSVRTLYHVSLTLDWPGKTLAAKQESHQVQVSLEKAFDEIESQLEEYKSSLRGEQWWKRRTRRKQLRQLKHGLPQPDLADGTRKVP